MKLMQLLSQISIDPTELEIPMPGPPDNTTVANVLSLAFGVAGLIAMLIIIIAGILFMLSRGDPQKSATARSAIIYAAIGLAISVAAFSIVGLVAEGF